MSSTKKLDRTDLLLLRERQLQYQAAVSGMKHQIAEMGAEIAVERNFR